jgi:rubrerythrin
MRETLERRKSEDLIVLECDQCGHREQVWGVESKACPICGGPMYEAPEFDDEDEYEKHR